MSEERNTHRYTCIGLRAASNGKHTVWYLDEYGHERSWKRHFGNAVGGVYEVEIEGDDPGRVYPKTARFVGMTDDPNYLQDLPKWRMESSIARNEQEAKQAENRIKRENAKFGELTLAEVKEMMRGSLAHRRYGMITAVINYLTGGY